MTNIHDTPDLTELLGDLVDDSPEGAELPAAERQEWRRRNAFLPEEEWHPDEYPR